MWSGPRNISTAMMRSWGNRADTLVIDEPFYAYYLKTTGLDHPAAAQIVEAGEIRWQKVVSSLLAPLPAGKGVLFQKQMTLHLLREVDREWLLEMKNCFLIRHPRDVIASYLAKRPRPDIADLGFVQQTELYRWLSERSGSPPPVLDARDVQNHPRSVLSQLCERLGLTFDESMLRWEPGRRQTDGLWAPHWYASVDRSTGFSPYREKSEALPEEFADVYCACLKAYEELHALRITP